MPENPLLACWDGEFGLPPFERINDEDFRGALDAAFNRAIAEVERIAEQDEAPSFANTIDRLELADRLLNRVAGVFYNLAMADSNEQRRELETEFSPRFAQYASRVAMNRTLFNRVDSLWQRQDQLALDQEQLRVLELYHQDFVRAGASLQGDDRTRFSQIRERLALIQTKFSQNLLADEAEWFMEVPESAVAVLPDSLADEMKREAGDRNVDGFVVTLNRSLIVPFLQFCPDRNLRRQTFLAWCNRGNNENSNNNLDIVKEILSLRDELAGLLDYDSYAAYKLEPAMAGTVEAVTELLETIWKPARSRALEDAHFLQGLLEQDGFNSNLEAWDWRYYAEKRRQLLHDYSDSETREYFELDRMIEAAFDCAERLFGLQFNAVDIPLYHQDCRCWNVTRDGKHLAVFIGDYHSRPSKRSGAWCSSFRDQGRLDGTVTPVVVNVCNFVRPDASGNCLLSFDDVRTLFHEMGHALHAMLSDVTYERISGTSVARDFVELPSQLYEHWMEQKDVLKPYARHVTSGHEISDALLDKLLGARNFDQGFATVEYLASALVDIHYHSGQTIDDPMTTQECLLDEMGMPDAIRMRHATPNFAHVFSGDGYSAGYYSYIWSEVLDADAFLAFKEEGGPFNQQVARRLEREILSRGGSARPETLYLNFRGRMPRVDALLDKRGLAGTTP